ncbi:MAG TPA: HD domain-containing protein [Candidatus Paceibacterota bacterium]|nr:HD domain-containing protein [Candidatus Paceibacterota bacterium]
MKLNEAGESSKINREDIPKYVTHVTETLLNKGFEAYIVGGCVRDLILGRTPKDWDVTTNAKPEEIQALFEKTMYENRFGTVTVFILKETDQPTEQYDQIEVTTYRKEAGYSDNRHPDKIEFSKTIEEDLERRDFTINAMAYDISQGHLKDIYGGLKDIKDKVVRTVGNADERFSEDALRVLRAIRFACELGFAVSYETLESISRHADKLSAISHERIRDEFIKIVMSNDPMGGMSMLMKLGLNKYVVPELEEGVGCEQKGEHIYDVFEHILHALGHAAEKSWPLDIRLSALFHDIGKPRTRRWDGTKAGGKGKYTFYGHEVIGARMVRKIMDRLRFPKELSEKVYKMVRYHMFFSDTEAITLSAVRRTIVNVGRENIWDLMKVRECDRVGMKKKEAPYRLRKYHSMIEEALRAPTSVSMLKIDGKFLMGELHMKPGPRMGWILHALLEECLEDDSKNTVENLSARVMELDTLSDKELKDMGEAGKQAKKEKEEEELGEIRKKHGV